jgi:hypothetical protein
MGTAARAAQQTSHRRGGAPTGLYRPRRPQASPLYRLLEGHFDAFCTVYDERFSRRWGYWRPVVAEVVEKFLACGILTRGFARVRCGSCKHEFLLAFSCSPSRSQPGDGRGVSNAHAPRLGDEIANELVNWFNAVDASYRADLDHLNELNFQRFDAKVEQRFAELEIKFEQRFAVFDKRLADVRADLIKWAFLFWMPTALAVLGLYFQ